MANQLAIKSHTQPGDEVIIEGSSHPYNFEGGAGAALSGVQFYCLKGIRGILDVSQIEEAIRSEDHHFPITRLICLENTHNRGGGSIYPVENMVEIYQLAKSKGLLVHLDGARLWNASVATGINPHEYARWADSVSVCLSIDAQGASLGTATVSLSAKMYVPARPRLGIANGTLIDPTSTFGATSNRTVTGVAATAGPEPLTRHVKLVTGANGRIEVGGMRLPYGIERVRLSASNGFGSSALSKARTVYNLGRLSRLPRRPRFVLVDKRSMVLYYVRDRRVVSHYDIAIGTPSTPTPNGYFKIGAALPASGPWGVLRRPLYRFSRSSSWPSGFYIHGTNAPWDIGTWASHGCVRLYNWAIRRFAKTVPNGTLVLIRR